MTEVQAEQLRQEREAFDLRELWRSYEYEYGIGSYREGVAAKLWTWFEDNLGLPEELERQTARAWEITCIAPLKRVAGQGRAVASQSKVGTS